MSKLAKVDSELQGGLGIAIARAFVYDDRNVGKMSLDILEGKVRALIGA